jgi:hypothetical protein
MNAPSARGRTDCYSGRDKYVDLWLQVRDVDAVGHELEVAGVDIIELPPDKPWGLREMQIRDPEGWSIVIVEVPETPAPASLSWVAFHSAATPSLRSGGNSRRGSTHLRGLFQSILQLAADLLSRAG